jgi:hypothetical protein
VFADNTNVAHQIAKDLPSATVLDGRFNVVQMSIAVPKQNTAAITIVDEFVRDAKRDGRPGGREALRALNRVCKGRVRGELEAVEGMGGDGGGRMSAELRSSVSLGASFFATGRRCPRRGEVPEVMRSEPTRQR